MKHSAFISLLIALGVVWASCAQSTKQDTKSLLWEISGNGLEKPSYVFGTHHLVPLSFLDSIKGLPEAFESTEQVIGELDMSDMTQMQMKIMSKSMMPEDTTYDILLSAEDKILLDSTLRDVLGTSMTMMKTMKPAILTNLISLTLYQKYFPTVAEETGIDLHFQEEARKKSKEVVGLEAVDDQIYALFDSQPLQRQAELLMCMIKNPELLKEEMTDLQEAYHSQDMKKLLALSEKERPNDPCPATQEEKDALNKNRNAKWLEQLPALLKSKPSFIAVGALHLPGKNGLIEGLRTQGFIVEAVN